MDVIGNNLANTNTLGFKAGNTYFSSMLNQSLSGSGALSVGQGVAVANISNQFSQGSFETTGNTTDMAIDGDGFFMVRDIEGATYYTRAGAFHIDTNGILVDGNGYKVQGYNTFSANTTSVSTDTTEAQEDISLKNVQYAPKASTETSIGANLDESAAYGQKFIVSQTVYDSKGGSHTLSTTFMKTEGSGTWGFDIKLDSDTDSLTADQIACGFVFDLNGNLLNMYKGDVASESQWGRGTVANAVEATAGDGTIGATAINHAGELDQAATGIILTKALAGDGAWTVSGYAGATATQTGTSLTVDLDPNVGTGADVTFTLADTWAVADTLTFDVAKNATSGSIVSSTVSRPGQLYKDTTVATGPLTLTKSSTAGVWTVTTAGGYTNAIAWQEADGDDQILKVDLDGAGGSDIVFNLGATTGNLWAADDTVTFDVNETDVATQDITLIFPDLGNGATIGVAEGSGTSTINRMTWDITADESLTISGYASSSVVKSLYNDGYSSGTLKSLSVSGTGVISGFFTNGQTTDLAQVLLADFPNPSGLKKIGNYFGETDDSGEAIINAAGSGGLGEIMSNTLETSNTDVAKEFVNMITAQRAYQASAKVITTADQMLSTLMNIKQ